MSGHGRDGPVRQRGSVAVIRRMPPQKGHAQAGTDILLARRQQGTHHQNEDMLPAGRRKAWAPCLQPLAQDLGNGIADISIGMVHHLILRIVTGNGCKAIAATMRRSESDAP